MTTEVHAEEIVPFRNGAWRLMRVTNSGRYMVPLKSGEAAMSFAPGDVLIADTNDNIIAGPIGAIAAIDLATRILNGDEREVTNTENLLALCAIVIDAGMRHFNPATEGMAG